MTEDGPRAGHAWARGVVTRALVALPLVAGLVTAGWLLSEGSDRPAAAPAEPVPALAGPGGGATGPSVLQATSPTSAKEPASRLDDWTANLAGPLDIPARALAGYAKGELALRAERPGCHLSWVTLAGVGKASSDHGRYGGDRLGDDGKPAAALGSVPLQGAASEAAEQRAGPMQLSPQEWKRFGTPGADLQNVDDAAIAAGRALCAGGGDLGGGDGWWNAVGGFRASDLFRQQVLGNAQLYATLSLDPARASTPSTRAARFALDQLGLPYVWGGNGPDAGAAGFDCSGLVKASYESAGVALPRTADSQFRAMPQVPPGQEPRMGDLVFYGIPATHIHHVGLYLGNGLMINAPTEGQAVQIHTFHTPGDDYAGAGRPSN